MRKTAPQQSDRALFYPAPAGLPVPVRPSRANAATLTALCAGAWPELVRAGALWLHGFIDEAHELAQNESSAEGSYLHALVHRSEGDFENSMYWFGKVGRHAIFTELHARISALPGGSKPAGVRWNPRSLVEFCERVRGGAAVDLDLLQRAAAIEYDLLMTTLLEQES